jgi:hypothetical protein
MTERKPLHLSWESFAEQQIREAQQAGKFDDLPGFGHPIPDIDEPYDEMWWVKKKMRDEKLSLLPPALQIRLDVETTLRSLLELHTESEVRQVVEALNERVRKANFAIVWGPSSTTMPLDVDRVVEEWRGNRSNSPR